MQLYYGHFWHKTLFLNGSFSLLAPRFSDLPMLIHSRFILACLHPDFARSINPIFTRGTDYTHLINYYWHTEILRPSDGPVMYIINTALCIYQLLPGHFKDKIYVVYMDRRYAMFRHEQGSQQIHCAVESRFKKDLNLQIHLHLIWGAKALTK